MSRDRCRVTDGSAGKTPASNLTAAMGKSALEIAAAVAAVQREAGPGPA